MSAVKVIMEKPGDGFLQEKKPFIIHMNYSCGALEAWRLTHVSSSNACTFLVVKKASCMKEHVDFVISIFCSAYLSVP